MNEERFTGKAAIYSEFRPGYPDDFLNYLYRDLGFSDHSIIADVGSGTGILTRPMLERGSTVYCIEPNDDMRSVAEKDLARFNKCFFLKTTAEHAGLEDASVDFITVAQAFHWFDRQTFKHEAARILREKGKVVLVWNIRDRTSELFAEQEYINRLFCPRFTGFNQGTPTENAKDFADFFKDGICEFRSFRNDLFYDERGFIGKSLSSSYSPTKRSETYSAYVKALQSMFRKYSINGKLKVPTLTRSFTGEV